MQDAGGGEMEGGMHMEGATSAAYMTLRNAGQQADRLIEVRSNIAEVVETHLTETIDGVASMSRVDGIDVPASGSVDLEPGGLHIMFINLNQDLNAGDTVRLTLVFEKSGEMDVSAPVRAP
jgi:periplasmic copper chaperone A